MRIVARDPAACRTAPSISTRMCGSDRSAIDCVASSRSPSKWNSSIQYAALATKKSRTGRLCSPSKLIAGPHSVAASEE
jgi:hypothetical protein